MSSKKQIPGSALLKCPPNFNNPLAELLRNTWLVLLYALSAIILLYVLGWSRSSTTYFFSIQVPTLAAITYVVLPSKVLSHRVPIFWTLTAIVKWSSVQVVSTEGKQPLTLEIGSYAFVLLIGILILRAILGTMKDAEDSDAAPMVGAVWGATLQLAFLALLLVDSFMKPLLGFTWPGQQLVRLLNGIRESSPIRWLPAWVFAGGILIYVAKRLRENPPRPPDYGDIFPVKDSPFLDNLLHVARLPSWIVLVVLKFVLHFLQETWSALKIFLDRWVSRLILILGGIVLPLIGLFGGHTLFLCVADRIEAYLQSSVNGGPFLARIVSLLVPHIQMLFGACLYIVSIAALTTEIRPVALKEVWKTTRESLYCEGFPAASAAGRAFSLYGILILAVPVAGLLPYGPGFGDFSWFYTAILVALIAFALLKKEPAT